MMVKVKDRVPATFTGMPTPVFLSCQRQRGFGHQKRVLSEDAAAGDDEAAQETVAAEKKRKKSVQLQAWAAL